MRQQILNLYHEINVFSFHKQSRVFLQTVSVSSTIHSDNISTLHAIIVAKLKDVGKFPDQAKLNGILKNLFLTAWNQYYSTNFFMFGFILKGRWSYIRVRRILSLACPSEHGGRARICGWIAEQCWTVSTGAIM